MSGRYWKGRGRCWQGEMIKAGMISVSMSSITSRIFIEATVTGEDSEAVVTIQDAHINITKITENGTVVFEKEAKAAQESKEPHR